MTKRAGFTLIELLVSIILMIILLSATTVIFVKTTETVATSQARGTVYLNARYALDMMENDLLGCLAFSIGNQRFAMENGKVNGPPAAPPTYNIPGFHYLTGPGQAAADRLLFRTMANVGGMSRTVEVCYELIPASSALGLPTPSMLPVPPTPPGLDSMRGATVRPPYRPLYTLVRRVRTQDPVNPQNFDRVPLDSFGNPVPDSELCCFVLSFNLEYFAQTGAGGVQFSQLDPSPFTTAPAPGPDPLGNGLGPNDGQGGGTPYRCPYIRVTLVIVEDVGARQEREIQKTIWIPMG